jgi:hemerythrin-like domain-containing protein
VKKSTTDVVDLIERDHRELEELFAKFGSTGEKAIAIAICDSLDQHTAGEEAAVYPVVAAELPNGPQMAGEGEDEHAAANALIARIRAIIDPCDELDRLVTELALLVEEHVDTEETEVLPQVRAVFEPDRLESLGREFEAAKS